MHLFCYTKWFKSRNSNPLSIQDDFGWFFSFYLVSSAESILQPCLIFEIYATFLTLKMAYPRGDLSVDLNLYIEFCLDPMLACGFCLSLAVSIWSVSELSKGCKSIYDKFTCSRVCDIDLELSFLKPFLRAPGDFTAYYLLRKSAVFPGLSSASSLGMSCSVSSYRTSCYLF